MRYPIATALTASALALLGSTASAQGGPPAGPTKEYICSLLTQAQVEKVLGRKIYETGGTLIAGGAVCDFDGDEAQVMLFNGAKGEANWDALLKRFGHANAKRTPVPGLGAPAYVIYPPPKNEYQATVAMVVVKTAPGTLVVSSSVKKGEPAEKALEPTVELVKIVLTKLR
jgi:hypothetical protein